MMEPLEVIIKNWQEPLWYDKWTPILIAVISLLTSIIALWWTREQYIRSARPYVYASSYATFNQATGNITNAPSIVGFRLRNAPTKIHYYRITISLGEKLIFNHETKNVVQFPTDDKFEWTFSIGELDYGKILAVPHTEQSNLIRKIVVEYSSLDGNRKYLYELNQKFIPVEQQWINIESKST